MSKLNERLTQLEEQTAALVIEAQELRKEICKEYKKPDAFATAWGEFIVKNAVFDETFEAFKAGWDAAMENKE